MLIGWFKRKSFHSLLKNSFISFIHCELSIHFIQSSWGKKNIVMMVLFPGRVEERFT